MVGLLCFFNDVLRLMFYLRIIESLILKWYFKGKKYSISLFCVYLVPQYREQVWKRLSRIGNSLFDPVHDR